MYKRIIVKLGTGVISKESGEIDREVPKHIVDQIALLRKRNVEVILVTSGAVGTGRGMLKLEDGADDIVKKQVYAAVGQVKLMSWYAELFGAHGILCAQVLATKEDFRDETHYLNMKNCLLNLLRDNVIPIVNENDVVAISELMFTDNDELAGLLASQLQADALVILTSVDGVIAGDPKDPRARILSEIDPSDSASFEKYITPERSNGGRGGMRAKFAVAKKLAGEGITTHIANGRKKDTLVALVEGAPLGTKFLPHKAALRT